MASVVTRPRILILTYTLISREPRALRQIHYFSNDFDVTTAGFGPAPDPSVPHIQLVQETAHSGTLYSRARYSLALALRLFRLARKWNLRDRAAYEVLSDGNWDVVIAHDVATISVANRLGARHGVLSDLHEYAPRQGENSRVWMLLIAPFFRWLCRTEVPKAGVVTTVGQGIIDEYRTQFGIHARLVTNATPFQILAPEPVSSTIRLVHSGVASPRRKLEVMIEAVKSTTADVTLDLYLVDPGSTYFRQLQEVAASCDRIRFMDSVPYAELVKILNRYDVGLSVIAPSTFNLEWCLPNKFFDFIQARLGIIIGPSPEMSRFVRTYDIGSIAASFSARSLSEELEKLNPKLVSSWKENADRYAHELSSEQQTKVWGEAVRDLLTRG